MQAILKHQANDDDINNFSILKQNFVAMEQENNQLKQQLLYLQKPNDNNNNEEDKYFLKNKLYYQNMVKKSKNMSISKNCKEISPQI